MTTPEKPQIRNVLATNAKTGQMWVCQPIELGIDDRICGGCKKQRLKRFERDCPNCQAKILWDLG
jgi:hypothetical protein